MGPCAYHLSMQVLAAQGVFSPPAVPRDGDIIAEDKIFIHSEFGTLPKLVVAVRMQIVDVAMDPPFLERGMARRLPNRQGTERGLPGGNGARGHQPAGGLGMPQHFLSGDPDQNLAIHQGELPKPIPGGAGPTCHDLLNQLFVPP